MTNKRSITRVISVLVVTMALLTTGCATRSISVYQNWGNQLAVAAQSEKTISDVSLMLGAEPYKCKKLEPRPMIGVHIVDGDNLIVKGIVPSGPAKTAGIEIGDKILSVNGKNVFSSRELSSLIWSEASPNEPLIIETDRDTASLQPKYPNDTSQCYWEITAGEVQKISGGAYANTYGGAASHGGTSYERFFRASCRFVERNAAGCGANWQE